MKPYPPSSYDEWRASVPWSNEAIAEAYEAQAAAARANKNEFLERKFQAGADYLRAGKRLSAKMLNYALPWLVKECTVVEDGQPCGRKALYRIGREGRCSRHRDIKTAGWTALQAARTVGHVEKSQLLKGHDNMLRSRWSLHQSKRPRRQR